MSRLPAVRLERLLCAPRLGLYGGSFDPAHLGHRAVARAARRAARLDAVVFVPAARSPHKAAAARFDDRQRLELLRLLLEREPQTGVWGIELERPAPSYTVETLESLARLRGAGAPRPFLILGEDQLAGLSRWKAPERLWALAEPLIVQRHSGAEFERALAAAAAEQPGLGPRLLAGAVRLDRPHPASATAIRAALARGAAPATLAAVLSAAQRRRLASWASGAGSAGEPGLPG